MGEMAYLSGAKRSASCIGATDGIMAAIPFDKLDNIHEEDPELSMKLQRALALASMEKIEENHKRWLLKPVYKDWLRTQPSLSELAIKRKSELASKGDRVERKDHHWEKIPCWHCSCRRRLCGRSPVLTFSGVVVCAWT